MSNINNKYSEYKKNRIKIKKVFFEKSTLSKRKIAIIVPFREQKEQRRGEMLEAFLQYMPKFLKKLNHKIYIIEQSEDGKKFNRGKLLNIGMEMAIKDKCEILISHDVDLLPCPDIRPYYATYSKYPLHIGDRWKDKYNYSTFIGGVLSLTPKLAKETNPTDPMVIDKIDKMVLETITEKSYDEVQKMYDENKPAKDKVQHAPVTNPDDLVKHLREMVDAGYTDEEIKSLHPELAQLFNNGQDQV